MSPHVRDPGAFGAVPGPIVPATGIRQSPPVETLAVPCPDCKAGSGERCRKPDGTPLTKGTVHHVRRRMARRAYNQQDHAGRSYALRRRPRERRETRVAAGLTQVELAALIGCNPATISFYETNKSRPVGEIGDRYGAWLYQQDNP